MRPRRHPDRAGDRHDERRGVVAGACDLCRRDPAALPRRAMPGASAATSHGLLLRSSRPRVRAQPRLVRCPSSSEASSALVVPTMWLQAFADPARPGCAASVPSPRARSPGEPHPAARRRLSVGQLRESPRQPRGALPPLPRRRDRRATFQPTGGCREPVGGPDRGPRALGALPTGPSCGTRSRGADAVGEQPCRDRGPSLRRQHRYQWHDRPIARGVRTRVNPLRRSNGLAPVQRARVAGLRATLLHAARQVNLRISNHRRQGEPLQRRGNRRGPRGVASAAACLPAPAPYPGRVP